MNLKYASQLFKVGAMKKTNKKIKTKTKVKLVL